MKSILTLLVLLFCTALFAQDPRVRPTAPSDPVRLRGRNMTVSPAKIVDGKLVIRTKETYVVRTNLLELESLVMMDGATIKLSRPKTTMIIQVASIGKGCTITGVGATGKPGADGANGKVLKNSPNRTRAIKAQNGQDGKPGGRGGPAKKLDLYVETIKFREPLNIILRGGRGGPGGNGGQGLTKKSDCSRLTVGTNGGDGGRGGPGGEGTLPRIMYGNGANPNAIISKAIPGSFGIPGKGGRAGFISRQKCGTRFAKTKKGKAGMNALPLMPFTNAEGQDASVKTNFPYPPPKPSAMVAELPVEIPLAATLGSIGDRLRVALQGCGYEDLRYYKVPEGYAVVTGMEQFTEKGVPLTDDRWSGDASFVNEFSLAGYLKSLFTARKGYFRLIVFMVTADDLQTKNERISREEALGWFRAGWSRLPKEIAAESFTPEHYVSALIYEFSITENGDEPIFSTPSSLSAEAHLRGAALWERLVSDQ